MADKKPAPKSAETIPVVDPETGKVGYIDPKFAPEAARTGLRQATDNQLRDAQIVANKEATAAELNKQYDGTIEGTVAPALAGAARGLTLGMSDVAMSELGEGVRRRLLDYQEYAPISSVAGEVGAIAGAALLGDEAGLGRLPGLVSKLGAGAESAIARGSSGALARIGGAAARGATEGAIYNAGKELGQNALQNTEMTAEKLIASGLHGAALGGAIGAGFGAAGVGVSKFMGRATSEAETAAASAGALPAAERAPGGISGMLEKAADAKTIKALGGSAGDIASLERNVAGGARRVAQDIRADIETATGRGLWAHSKESLHEYATARVGQLGEKLGGMLKRLDDAGTGITPDARAFAATARKELLTPLMVETPAGAVVAPGAAQQVKAVNKFLSQVEAATEGRSPSFTEWQSWRSALDKQIYKSSAKASPATETLRNLRALMEKELESSGEAAAKNMGGAFVDEYQATKSLYQSVRKAADLTERSVARQSANNSFGLGAVIGGAAGLVSGGPVVGAAMGLGGKLLKDRGDMLAADLLGRASNMTRLMGAVSRSNAKVSEGVASLVGSKPAEQLGKLSAPKQTGGFVSELLKSAESSSPPRVQAGASTSRTQFSKRSEAIASLTSNPSLLSQRMSEMLGPVAQTSPRIAAAVTAKAMGDLRFLESKLPPSRRDTFSLQPQLQPATKASDAEIAKHARYVQALDNPAIVLSLAAKGNLTPDHVEAVRERYPLMYDEMRSQIFSGLVASKTEVPYARRIQLGILLDLPTDKTLAPDFVQAIQATYTAADKAGQEPPPPQLSRLDVADSLMTGTQSAVSEGRTR